MIKQANRLLGKRRVSRVLSKGKNVKTANFSCRFLKTGPESSPLKVTVVVSKKTASKAVERNLIKRRVREAFEPSLKLFRGVSIVVFPRYSAKEADFKGLMQEAKVCLEKAQSS